MAYSSPSGVESDLRQAEIVYHQKVDLLLLLIGLALYLFFTVFDFMTGRYFQSLIFVLLTVNGLTALAVVNRTKDPDKMVLLKRIFGGIAFLLLAMLIFIGISGRDFYLFLPWIFSYPVSLAIMFGKRIGIYSTVAYTVILLVLMFFVDIPEWSTNTGSLLKWNAALTLVVITGFLTAAERSRRMEQRELVAARYEHKASENRQREINAELEHEISLRIQSEKKLGQSELRYRALFEESDVSLWEEDWSSVKLYLSGLSATVLEDLNRYFSENSEAYISCLGKIRVTAVNPAALNLLGVTSRQDFCDYFSKIRSLGPFRAYMAERMTALYQNGRHTGEIDALTMDDKALKLLVTSSIPAGFEQSWAKMFTSVHDLTERVAMEEKRKRMDRQLQQAGHMQAVATLAGGIAHQFNNALTGISGNLELIGLDENVSASHANRLETLRTMADRMRGFTDQLLAYARGGKYRPRSFYVNDLIRDLLDANRIRKADAIELNLRFDSTVCEIRGDTTQIGMVIEAVLANAIESIKENGILSITTRNLMVGESEAGVDMSPGQYAVIEIQDNGEGMDDETRDRIFEPFFTTRFFGRGLGMAAAYGIVQNHGGSITVWSERHNGTRVTIQLPANEKPMNETQSAA